MKREESMSLQRRYFLLVVALATATATAALGQTAAPGFGPGGWQTQSSVPDFSTTWARLSLPGFEPPLSGPGPVTNRSRRPDGAANLQQLVGDYTNPVLKPQAAEVVKKAAEIALRGIGYPTPRNQCWPGGVPFVFSDMGMQMIQEADRVTILYVYDHQVRRVRLNAAHPAQVTPSWFGDSVGHYEGDTLVIDTIGIKVGPFAMVDWYGTPHTAALHVVERYRLIDDEAAKEAETRSWTENVRLQGADFPFAANPNDKSKALQLQFTVEDEGVFTAPWTATVTYRHPLSPLVARWPEYACAENVLWYSGKDAAVPTAHKADF
jgi:hypothetical protein